MSSSVAELFGVQTPRVHLAPPAASNEADDAVFLAASYGLVPDPWQEHVLRGWLGMTAGGKWAAPRCGLAVPRQNGKNGVLEIRELYGLVVRGEKFLHTAHEVKTARKAFLRLLSFFDNPRQFPELAGLVKEIRKTNGQEAIVLTNGGSVEFIARSKGSGRGFTVDVLVMDEAQELDEDANAALQPTISAAPSGNPQKILTGTPPAPKMRGGVFLQMRTAGVEGKDSRLCWDEWSCAPDADLNDPSNWAFSNPALGDRLQVEVAADERADMDDERFGRERCGIWFEDASLGIQVIPAGAWAACLDTSSSIVTAPVFAVDVSPLRNWAAIAVAGANEAGRIHVEVTSREGIVDHRRETDWIVPRLADLRGVFPSMRVAMAAGQGAEGLKLDIEAAGIPVDLVGPRDVAAACGMVFDYAMTQKLAHLAQPPLDAALKAAKKRIEDGEGAWMWGRKRSAADITPVYAVTLALRAAVLALNDSKHPINNVW